MRKSRETTTAIDGAVGIREGMGVGALKGAVAEVHGFGAMTGALDQAL